VTAAPGEDTPEKKERIGRAKEEMAEFYAKAVAEDVARLVQLLGDMTAAVRRDEAIEIVGRLVMHARGEAEFGMPSPAEEMLKKLGMEHARLMNPQPAERRQRRELLRPYVKAVVSEYPSAKPARIITLLLKGKDFRETFSATSRRTLDADAKALLKEFPQT
jgi:hypothetical protein